MDAFLDFLADVVLYGIMVAASVAGFLVILLMWYMFMRMGSSAIVHSIRERESLDESKEE